MRLVVIVSGDYGELGAAMYFLQGLRSPESPVLMLPTSLAHTKPAMDGLTVRAYAGLAELRRAMAEANPDTVVLTSGYLLPINSGLSLLDSVRLLRSLGARHLTVLTSDPFVGLLRSRALDLKDLHARVRNRRSAFVASWRFALSLFLVRHMLRRAWHIYPMPIDDLRSEREVRRLSYYSAAAQHGFDAGPAGGQARPTWLFVLSKTDFGLQLGTQGDEEFVERMVGRLRDSVELGRDATLIGPAELVEAVLARLGAQPGVTARSDIPYAEYMSLLMQAEYVFFWNYFSFSVIHRVLAELPVFFFHEGHMVHILPALWKEGVRVVYDGWRPPLLPMDKGLDERDLSLRAGEATREFRRVGDGLRRCPSPEEILRLATSRSRS